jgi:serine/threonine-protein kinase
MSSDTLTAAADLYALGALAYHALTGTLPFPGPDFVAQHLGPAPPRPSQRRAAIDPAWDEILLHLLAVAPDERPGTLEDVRAALIGVRIDDDEPTRVAEPAPAAVEAEQPRFVRERALPDGAGGPIALGHDTRLGRPVVMETLSAAWLEGERGQLHLRWLREMSRLGGPRLQHIYALVPRDDGGLDAIFEVLDVSPARLAPSDGLARRQLLATLARLHEASVAHGSVAGALTREPHGPMLRLAGLAPTEGATPDDDRRALA